MNLSYQARNGAEEIELRNEERARQGLTPLTKQDERVVWARRRMFYRWPDLRLIRGGQGH